MPVDQTCGLVYPWPTPPDTYQQAIIKAATFSYPWSRRDSEIEFLVLTSATDKSWNTADFLVDNPPGEYWSPPRFWSPEPQSLTPHPDFEPYPDRQNPKIFTISKATITALAVVPIYVKNGIQYCMTRQLGQTTTYVKQNQDKYIYIDNISTTTSSPIFATIVVEFFK
jgi:hypothetical protein